MASSLQQLGTRTDSTISRSQHDLPSHPASDQALQHRTDRQAGCGRQVETCSSIPTGRSKRTLGSSLT
jgi:hypothetical protein